MLVEELYDLTTWIKSNIVEEGIVQKYQELHQILNQNVQPNQVQQPFEEQQKKLINALKKIPLSELSFGQIELLRELGIAQNIGDEGVALIEDVLFKNAVDIANASEKIHQCISELNEGIQWAEKEEELLAKVVTSDGITPIGDQVLLRVHFAGDASIENLSGLKQWSKIWWEIGRGISMAHNQSPESISVVGASKGSIIVSLLTANLIASTVSSIILSSLKVVEKYYDIRRKAQEVRGLELDNKEAENALERAANETKESGVEDIVKQTISELGLDQNNEGDKVNELTSATKKLVDFITKGGEVDFVMPDEEEVESSDDEGKNFATKNELRIKFQEIRKLEREIKRLQRDHS